MHTDLISLEQRPVLEKKLKQNGKGLSDYSFANVYLFRNSHQNRIIRDNDIDFIKGKTYDGYTYLMPTQAWDKLEIFQLKELLKDVDFLFPVPEQCLKYFPEDVFDRTYSDAESDYVYEISKMASYAGNKLHKKRNLLKQFEANYEHSTYPLIDKYLDGAVEILDSWQQDSMQQKQDTDYQACLEAIRLNEQLVLCGMIYYVGDEPAGFVLGEELTADMFDVKFAKAKKKFKGIYQYLFNAFAKILPEKYLYYNFEEDLGSEGLKHTKSSYKPFKKLLKYRVRLR
jgi:hypothetical protein